MHFRKTMMIGSVGALLAVAGCEQPDRSVRQYREINFKAENEATPSAPRFMGGGETPAPAVNGAMPDLPPALRGPALALAWETPAGWDLQPKTGIRIATFRVEGQECTILSFPGEVGSDAANIGRWLGQAGGAADDAALAAFTSSPETLTTAGGFTARFYDLAPLLPEGAAVNVLAAILPVGDQSVFVKLMGDAGVLQRQKGAFLDLCRSLRRDDAPASAPAAKGGY
jgi:hypothetical protein